MKTTPLQLAAVALALLASPASALMFTNTPNGSWRYSELIATSPHGTAYVPTSTNEYAQATFRGYVGYEGVGGVGPAVVDLGGNLGYQILTTWLISATNRNLDLVFDGDDGHGLFVDGQFVGGGGFAVVVSNSVSLTAGVPRKLELAIYNAFGGWAGYLALGPWNGMVEGNWSNLLERAPGLMLNADGFSPEDILLSLSFSPDGSGVSEPELHYSHADPDSYVVLYRGTNLNDISTPVAIQLNSARSSGVLRDAAPLVDAPAVFYRLWQIPVSDPLDLDGDGIDDVYELRHPEFLNPLDANDAAQDFDHDGVKNLQEYLAGTDPARAPEPVKAGLDWGSPP